jgi:hypothetical protein
MRHIFNFLKEDDKVIKAEINLRGLAATEDCTPQHEKAHFSARPLVTVGEGDICSPNITESRQ